MNPKRHDLRTQPEWIRIKIFILEDALSKKQEEIEEIEAQVGLYLYTER